MDDAVAIIKDLSGAGGCQRELQIRSCGAMPKIVYDAAFLDLDFDRWLSG